MKLAVVTLAALAPVSCWALLDLQELNDDDFNRVVNDWDKDMRMLLEKDRYLSRDTGRDLLEIDELSTLQTGQVGRPPASQAVAARATLPAVHATSPGPISVDASEGLKQSAHTMQAATPPTMHGVQALGVQASGAQAAQQPGGGAPLLAPVVSQAPTNVDQGLARAQQVASLLAQDASMLADEMEQLQGALRERGIKAHPFYQSGYKEVAPPGKHQTKDHKLVLLDSRWTKGLQTTPSGDEGANTTSSVEKDTNWKAWFHKRTFKSSFFTLNHKLSDLATCLVWAGASLLILILAGVCCVRPLLNRRQDGRNQRLL